MSGAAIFHAWAPPDSDAPAATGKGSAQDLSEQLPLGLEMGSPLRSPRDLE
jgi:hypothetical protein